MSKNAKNFSFLNPETYGAKPCVAISACLNGQTVRYDGKSKSLSTRHYLSKHVNLLEHCPEVSVGMPIPRPAIELVRFTDGTHALERDNPSEDVTDSLIQHREEHLLTCSAKNICAYIFKSKSPSCGIGTTPIHDPDGQVTAMGNGLHADYFSTKMPWIIFRDENQLQTVAQCKQFIFLCLLVYDLQCSMKRKQLHLFHQHYQFFLQQISIEIEKKLAAALDPDDPKNYQTAFKIEMEKLLKEHRIETFAAPEKRQG